MEEHDVDPIKYKLSKKSFKLPSPTHISTRLYKVITALKNIVSLGVLPVVMLSWVWRCVNSLVNIYVSQKRTVFIFMVEVTLALNVEV